MANRHRRDKIPGAPVEGSLRHPAQSRSRLLVPGVTFGVLAIGVVAFGLSVGADSTAPTATTYYACLNAGQLSQVGTTQPTCTSPATPISWNSQGPVGPTGPAGGLPVVLGGSSYGFSLQNEPTYATSGIIAAGNDIWVSGTVQQPQGTNSVTEISAITGSVVRVLSGGNYGFNVPEGLAFDGTNIWVANWNGNSVTELNESTGAWVKTLSDSSYDFSTPFSLAFDGKNIWVANNHSVTVLNAASGALVENLSASVYGFSGVSKLLYAHHDIWATNLSGNSITEIAASNGGVLRVVSLPQIQSPEGLAFDGTNLWISSAGNNAVVEVNASTGNLVGSFTNGISSPRSIVYDGKDIWVVNEVGSLTELSDSGGTWLRSVSDAQFGFTAPMGATFDGTNLWVANTASDTVTSFRPTQ